MKYIAFDIEAANGYKADSICSIGIVVADEHLQVVHSENIWINPKCKYNLNGTRANIGINLHLDKAVLDKCPDFSQVYGRIVDYLTDPDAVIIGHAVDSDVRMLNATCKRYNLPSIDYDFVCTQLLFRLYKDEKEVRSLTRIADELQLTFEAHNSRDDAWMSLMTLQHVIDKTGLSLPQLIEQYSIAIGNNSGFVMRRCVTLQGANNRQLLKMAMSSIRDTMAECTMVDDICLGHVYAFARTLELRYTNTVCQTMAKLASHGALYTTKLHKCTHFVTTNNPHSQDLMRYTRALELANDGKIKIIEIQDITKGR